VFEGVFIKGRKHALLAHRETESLNGRRAPRALLSAAKRLVNFDSAASRSPVLEETARPALPVAFDSRSPIRRVACLLIR